MKKTLLLILGAILLMSCTRLKDFERAMYECPDGTKTLYLADSIYIKDYAILQHKKTGQYFVIPQHFYAPKGLKVKYMVTYPDCYMMNPDLCKASNYDKLCKFTAGVDIFHLSQSNTSLISEYNRKDRGVSSRDFTVVDFHRPPLFFRVAFVRGDVYNYLCNICITEKTYRSIPFSNPQRFYPVLLPVWEGE